MPDPGWYDDPQDPTQLRWWDGSRWTDRRQPRSAAIPPPSGSSYGIPLPTDSPTTSDPWGSATKSSYGAQTPPPSTTPASDDWARGPSHTGPMGGGRYPAPPMTFPEAISSGFRNYIVFRGRASRSEYWYWTLFLFLFAIIAGLAIGTILDVINDPTSFDGLLTLLLLPLLLPTVALTMRRLHDVGMSGWFILVSFIPWIGFIAAVIFGLMPGQDHANEYG